MDIGNTHATTRVDDYVLVHVNIIPSSIAKHNVERESVHDEWRRGINSVHGFDFNL